MLKIQDIIRDRKQVKSSKITLKWQDRAYQMWQEFGLPRTDLGNLFRFFKLNYDKYPGLVEQCYTFTVDYEGNVPKLKLFYWKFSQLKK